MPARIVFMGSPQFAVPTLQALAEHYPVVGTVTQPDRPAGRGRELTSPPVKRLAQALNIPVIQPPRLSEPQVMQQLHDWQPDLIVVAAFGQILRQAVLNLPPHGCVNVHASLLPRWRGAAPIQAAILHGDHETGITIMRMDAGIDTGPILSQRETPVYPDDTADSLSERLAHVGADLLIRTLSDYLRGKILPKTQDEAQATYATMLSKADGRLDFSQSAEALALRVRAMNSWPGAFTEWQGQPIKVLRAQAVSGKSPGLGVARIHKGKPAIGAANGLLVLEEVQPAGKRPISGAEYLRGARDWETRVFGRYES